MRLLSFVTIAAILFLVAVTFVPSSYARVISGSRSTKTTVDFSDISWGKYLDRKVYVQGKWTAAASGSGTVFTGNGLTLKFETIAKEECAYVPVRIKAQKAWGGKLLNQADSRIESILLSKSYGGFKWILPGVSKDQKKYFWCLGQDAKTSVLISIENPGKELLEFINGNLLRQLAVRSAVR
jgi:hypothetical protein